LPDDRMTVKCLYCGVDVIVREAIQLAAGKVKEFTPALPTESRVEISPEVPATSKAATIVCFGFGALLLLIGVATIVRADKQETGAGVCGGAVILIALVLFIAGRPKPAKYAQYVKRHSGWRCECPYCSTVVSLPAKLGADCPACNKRIVIRDEKFYSVETPVSGLKIESKQ
jgi:hypothetical protein